MNRQTNNCAVHELAEIEKSLEILAPFAAQDPRILPVTERLILEAELRRVLPNESAVDTLRRQAKAREDLIAKGYWPLGRPPQ